eukprot:gene2746-3731_t
MTDRCLLAPCGRGLGVDQLWVRARGGEQPGAAALRRLQG